MAAGTVCYAQCPLVAGARVPPKKPILLGSERDRPLHFAGRHEELGQLAARLNYIREQSDPSGGMVLITGLQGIGKTQLLAEFVRRATADDPSVLHVAFTTNELPADERELVAALVEGLVDTARSKLERAALLTDWMRELSVAGVGRITSRSTGKTLGGLLRQTRQAGWWEGRALVVTVDEIQSIGRAARQSLKILHEGVHGCPIMLIGAGLQHSRAALARRYELANGEVDDNAISRFAMRLTLGNLSMPDTEEAIGKAVQVACGVELPVPVRKRLAEASWGFPQHIHGYIAGVIEAVPAVGDSNMEQLLETALAKGDERRFAYYEDRLMSMEWPQPIAALAEAMAERDGEISWVDAERLAAPLLPEDVSAREVLQSAIEKGVLSQDAMGALRFGIPSFLQFVVDAGRR